MHLRHWSTCTISLDSDKHIAKEDGSYINASEISVSIISNHYYMLREVNRCMFEH